MLSTWIAFSSIASALAAPRVDIGHPLPGSHETVFLAPSFWDPTDPLHPSYELATILDDVVAHAAPEMTDTALHALTARLADEIEREALDTIHRDPTLRYTGLYLYLQEGGRMHAVTSAWYDIDFAERDPLRSEADGERGIRERAYVTKFLADFCAQFPGHPTCRRAGRDG